MYKIFFIGIFPRQEDFLIQRRFDKDISNSIPIALHLRTFAGTELHNKQLSRNKVITANTRVPADVTCANIYYRKNPSGNADAYRRRTCFPMFILQKYYLVFCLTPLRASFGFCRTWSRENIK